MNALEKPDSILSFTQWGKIQKKLGIGLGSHGDPYTRIGADLDGRVGIDWGVYGVPETYIINKEGVIVYKHIGPVSAADLESIILPQVEMLQATRK